MNDPIDGQKWICEKYGALYCPCKGSDRVGIAIQTLQNEPIYGTRELNPDGSSSWYIYAGQYSADDDFYKPVCIDHLETLLPIVLRYLALPPGWKFIIDKNGYEDVWQEKI